MIRQRLNVVPQGLVTGGYLNLDIDETTGLIAVDEDILFGLVIFGKEIKKSGFVRANPADLLSKNLALHAEVAIGPVGLAVAALSKTQADVTVTITDPESAIALSGNAVVDLTGEYLRLTSLNLSGTIDGQKAVIQMTEA